VPLVHLSFDVMVALGSYMALVGCGPPGWRSAKRDLTTRRRFLRPSPSRHRAASSRSKQAGW